MTHQEMEGNNRFSKEVTGVSLIYGGHGHTSMLQTNFDTAYLKADLDFRSIWTSRLEFYAATSSLAAPTVMTHRSIPSREALSADAGLEMAIAGYAVKIGRSVAQEGHDERDARQL